MPSSNAGSRGGRRRKCAPRETPPAPSGRQLKFSGIKSIAVNAGYLTAARVLPQVLRIFYVIVLARYLGPEIYGLLAYGQSWYMAFFPMTVLGLGVVLIREVGRDRGRGAAVVEQTLAVRIVLSIAAAVVCGFIGWTLDDDPTARRLLLVFSLALAGRGLATWAENVFSAYEVSRHTLRQEAVFRPLEVALGLLVLALGGGAIAVAGVHAAVWWAQAARGWLIVRASVVPARPRCGWDRVAPLLAQGLPLFVSALFFTWLLQGPLVLFRHIADNEHDLGQLALAMQAFFALCAVPWSISLSALPVLSRATVRQDGKDVLFASAMARIAILFGALAGLSAMALGPWLVDSLFGGRYVLAGRLLGPALWLLVPMAAGTAAAQVLVAQGRLISQALCAIAGAGVMTALMFALKATMGPGGALVAAGAGLSIWALSLIAALAHGSALKLGHSVLRPGTAALLALAVYLGLMLLGAATWQAFVAALVALASVAAALRVVAPDEVAALLAAFRQRPSAAIASTRDSDSASRS